MTKLSICALFLVVFVVSDIVQGKGGGGGNGDGGVNAGGGFHVHGHGHGGHGHGGHGHGGHGHGGRGHGHGHGHRRRHGKKHVQVCKQADGSIKLAVNIPCIGGFTKTVGYDPKRGVVVTDKTNVGGAGFNVCADAIGKHRVAGVDGEIGGVGLNPNSENGITVGNLNILNNAFDGLFQGGGLDCSKGVLGETLGRLLGGKNGGGIGGILQGVLGGGGGGGKGGGKGDLVIDVHGGRGKGGSTGSLIDEGKGGGGGGCSSSSSSSDCSDSADGGPHGGAGLDGEFNVGQ